MERKIKKTNTTTAREGRMENEMDSCTIGLQFASGYESSAVLDQNDVTTGEYWVVVTEAQNPYDLADYVVKANGVEMDEDGAWLDAINDEICESLNLNLNELYGE